MDRARSTRTWISKRFSRRHDGAETSPKQKMVLPELARLGGVAFLKLPNSLSPLQLAIPTRFAATAGHLLEYGRSTTGLFRVSGSAKVISSLTSHFTRQVDESIRIRGRIEISVRTPALPGISFTTIDVASAFKKFLSDIPGGLLGSVAVFESLRNIQTTGYPHNPPSQDDLDASRSPVEHIALVLLRVSCPHRLSLITAVVALLTYIKHDPVLPDTEGRATKLIDAVPPAGVMTSHYLSVLFAPLLLGELTENINVSPENQAVFGSSVSTQLQQRTFGSGAASDGQASQLESKLLQTPELAQGVQQNKLAESVIEMLIHNWTEIVAAMKLCPEVVQRYFLSPLIPAAEARNQRLLRETTPSSLMTIYPGGIDPAEALGSHPPNVMASPPVSRIPRPSRASASHTPRSNRLSPGHTPHQSGISPIPTPLRSGTPHPNNPVISSVLPAARNTSSLNPADTPTTIRSRTKQRDPFSAENTGIGGPSPIRFPPQYSISKPFPTRARGKLPVKDPREHPTNPNTLLHYTINQSIRTDASGMVPSETLPKNAGCSDYPFHSSGAIAWSEHGRLLQSDEKILVPQSHEMIPQSQKKPDPEEKMLLWNDPSDGQHTYPVREGQTNDKRQHAVAASKGGLPLGVVSEDHQHYTDENDPYDSQYGLESISDPPLVPLHVSISPRTTIPPTVKTEKFVSGKEDPEPFTEFHHNTETNLLQISRNEKRNVSGKSANTLATSSSRSSLLPVPKKLRSLKNFFKMERDQKASSSKTREIFEPKILKGETKSTAPTTMDQPKVKTGISKDMISAPKQHPTSLRSNSEPHFQRQRSSTFDSGRTVRPEHPPSTLDQPFELEGTPEFHTESKSTLDEYRKWRRDADRKDSSMPSHLTASYNLSGDTSSRGRSTVRAPRGRGLRISSVDPRASLPSLEASKAHPMFAHAQLYEQHRKYSSKDGRARSTTPSETHDGISEAIQGRFYRPQETYIRASPQRTNTSRQIYRSASADVMGPGGFLTKGSSLRAPPPLVHSRPVPAPTPANSPANTLKNPRTRPTQSRNPSTPSIHIPGYHSVSQVDFAHPSSSSLSLGRTESSPHLQAEWQRIAAALERGDSTPDSLRRGIRDSNENDSKVELSSGLIESPEESSVLPADASVPARYRKRRSNTGIASITGEQPTKPAQPKQKKITESATTSKVPASTGESSTMGQRGSFDDASSSRVVDQQIQTLRHQLAEAERTIELLEHRALSAEASSSSRDGGVAINARFMQEVRRRRELESELKEWKEGAMMLEEELERAYKEMEKMREELGQTRKELERTREELGRIREDLLRAEIVSRAWQDRAARAEAQLEDAEERATAAEARLQEADDELRTMRQRDPKGKGRAE